MSRSNYLSMAILLIFSTFLSACDDDFLENLSTFNLSYESEMQFAGTFAADLPIVLQTPDIESNSETRLSAQNTRADLVEEINLVELILEIESPPQRSFSFLREITISIEADGLPLEELASASNIDIESQTLELEPNSDLNLKDYILSDEFSIQARMVTRELITQEIDLKVSKQFRVRAQLVN